MVVARAVMRHQEKSKAYGKISAKALAVLTALLWRFHNAAMITSSGVASSSAPSQSKRPAATRKADPWFQTSE
jgi:hypothetical protein